MNETEILKDQRYPHNPSLKHNKWVVVPLGEKDTEESILYRQIAIESLEYAKSRNLREFNERYLRLMPLYTPQTLRLLKECDVHNDRDLIEQGEVPGINFEQWISRIVRYVDGHLKGKGKTLEFYYLFRRKEGYKKGK